MTDALHAFEAADGNGKLRVVIVEKSVRAFRRKK